MSEWDGEGLPPVGVECEFKEEEPKSKCFSNWSKCEILAYNTKKANENELQVVIRDYNGDAAIIYSNDKPVFRKPETEAERNERERLEADEELYNTCMSEWEHKQILEQCIQTKGQKVVSLTKLAEVLNVKPLNSAEINELVESRKSANLREN